MINRLVIAVLLTLATNWSCAQQQDTEYQWEEKRTKKGIAIYTSSVENSSFDAVRGTVLVKASVESLVALVEDHDRCSDWADLCEESRVEKRVSDTETYVYVYNNVPFPVSDRDVYAHVKWHHDDQTGKVSMTSTAIDGGPSKTQAVRIETAFTQWHFTPQSNGLVLVENFAHIDPNGPVPAWITNRLLVDSPFKTLNNMRDIVEAGAYQNTKVPFLN